jgi:hypothetical protein
VYNINEPVTNKLELNPLVENYFDNKYEIEIEILCRGLLNINNGLIDRFEFSPIDDRDFKLIVQKESEKVKVEIQSFDFYFNRKPFMYQSTLSIAFYSNENLISKFYEQLNNELDLVSK